MQLNNRLTSQSVVTRNTIGEKGRASCVHGILQLLVERAVFIAVMHAINQGPEAGRPQRIDHGLMGASGDARPHIQRIVDRVDIDALEHKLDAFNGDVDLNEPEGPIMERHEDLLQILIFEVSWTGEICLALQLIEIVWPDQLFCPVATVSLSPHSLVEVRLIFIALRIGEPDRAPAMAWAQEPDTKEGRSVSGYLEFELMSRPWCQTHFRAKALPLSG
jgi:hypothetical protein